MEGCECGCPGLRASPYCAVSSSACLFSLEISPCSAELIDRDLCIVFHVMIKYLILDRWALLDGGAASIYLRLFEIYHLLRLRRTGTRKKNMVSIMISAS